MIGIHPKQFHTGISSVCVVGLKVSEYSECIIELLAREAKLSTVHITSVKRQVEDQARTFYKKHIVEGKVANYKNPSVARMISHAKELRKKGTSEKRIIKYLINSIQNARGGAQAISHHLGYLPFCEVFDVAHYSGPTIGAGRHNYMTDSQANAFLNACRKRIPRDILRLGHSKELGINASHEFLDEKCFHIELRQPIFDKLEKADVFLIA